MRILTKLGAVAAAVLLTVFAQAQTQTPPPTAPLRPAPRPTNGPARPIQRFDRTLQDLTEDQRNKVQEANKTYSAAGMPIYSRLTATRRELDALINQDKLDETAIRAKAKEI